MNGNEAITFKIGFTPNTPSRNWSTARTAQWLSNRRFYTCNALSGEIDVAEYIANAAKITVPGNDLLREQAANRLGIDLTNRVRDKSEARSIDEYMTRFNSLGAFDRNGVMTKAELNKWREGAKTTQSIVWHGVISLSETQSRLVGYEDMERLIRQTFGGFLKNAGFDPNNIALLCTMHTNTENHHVHFAFYEKEPKYLDKYGKPQYKKIGVTNTYAINEYRMSATAFLDQNKADLSKFRDTVVNTLRGAIWNKELYVALRNLDKQLPKKGRLQYNSANIAPYRKDIDSVVQLMLKSNPIAMAAHKKALLEIARRGNELSETGADSDYMKKLTADYKGRLGNVVLGLVIQYRDNPNNYVRGEPQTSKQFKARARRRRVRGGKLIHNVMKVLASSNSVQADFTRSLEEAEQEIQRSGTN